MKIIVIGEKCLDKFIYGNVDRLSPEAPIPVFVPKHIKSNDGMAGNVFNNLKKLSSKSEIFLIHQSNEIIKTRFVEDKSNYPFIRVDEFENEIKRIVFTDEMMQSIKSADAVIVSDYDKGFLTEDDLINIADNAKFSVLDTKKKLSKSLIENYFNFIKLNESEFKNNYTEDDIVLKKLIITLGAKGCKYFNVIFPSDSPKETIDVSGAGDTFTAAFTTKYLEVEDVNIAVSYANKMATVVVSKRGVATP
jgi:D-beta-D-heptose 7-phosphate kinase/D-beta-D-heptose 1-phosphate adenosyltransferase